MKKPARFAASGPDALRMRYPPRLNLPPPSRLRPRRPRPRPTQEPTLPVTSPRTDPGLCSSLGMAWARNTAGPGSITSWARCALWQWIRWMPLAGLTHRILWRHAARFGRFGHRDGHRHADRYRADSAWTPDGNSLTSILEIAQAQGLVGGGWSPPSTSPTPLPPPLPPMSIQAGMRDDIAAQMLEHGVDVILGGGEDDFLPQGETGCFPEQGNRSDGRNLITEAQAAGLCHPL